MSINTSIIEPQTILPPQKFGEDDVFYSETDGKPMAETDIHRELMNYLIEALKVYFQKDENVYVSGNILLYYVEGNPKKCVAPDVMICFGVEKKKWRVYKLWEEERVPQVVFEISSTSTWRDDLSKKYSLYEKLGVKEYY
ncbi:MAG: Uma2 family endonuclease, partial [Aridibacter sp.]